MIYQYTQLQRLHATFGSDGKNTYTVVEKPEHML